LAPKPLPRPPQALLPGCQSPAIFILLAPTTTSQHRECSKAPAPAAKIENAALDALLHVLEDLNVDVSSGIDDTNMVDFVNKVQYSIKDGHIQFGFDVNLDGTVTASYLFHKELEITETFAKIPMP